MKGPRLVFGVLEHRVVKFRGPTSVVGERNQLVASTKCFLCKYPNDGGDQLPDVLQIVTAAPMAYAESTTKVPKGN